MPSAFEPGPAAARPERPLMKRDGQHARVVAKQRLGPVAVVHVEVDDRDALETELALRVASRDGGVAEDAEPHRRALERVMAGRAHESEPAELDRANRAARGETRGIARARNGVRVGVEPPLRVDRLDRVDVARASGRARSGRDRPAPRSRSRGKRSSSTSQPPGVLGAVRARPSGAARRSSHR